MTRLYALRGAAQCDNTIDDIRNQIGLMYDELIDLNHPDKNDIVSIIFSVTADLNAVNPSTALRQYMRKNGDEAGSEYALFSVQEPECSNSLERTVRVIIHCYLEEGSKPKHVYRNGAEVLRPDRAKRQ